ncbi:MAG: NfeD family protein, partial [Burkholderiales bacterium]|nr:NfeD family protein [Burkholderiales bacterium]
SKWGKSVRRDPATDHNVNLDVGQSLHVDAWQQDGPDRHMARAQYRGAEWDVQLQTGAPVRHGRCVIRAVRGSCLVVEPE